MQTNCPGGIILAQDLMPCAALSTSGLSPMTSKISPGALSGEGVILDCHINENLELMCLGILETGKTQMNISSTPVAARDQQVGQEQWRKTYIFLVVSIGPI